MTSMSAGVPAQAQQKPLAAGVSRLCAIDFSKDARTPARVEDSALPCLQQAAEVLKSTPGIKIVLVGVSHPLYDHSEEERGMEREGEDMSGTDIRFSDVASYRAINTKEYLVHWLGADATRVIPTTDEYSLGQRVTLYSVPVDADFWHNYTKTTPINELKCTIKPCPNPDEDVLTPQPRGEIKTDTATR